MMKCQVFRTKGKEVSIVVQVVKYAKSSIGHKGSSSEQESFWELCGE